MRKTPAMFVPYTDPKCNFIVISGNGHDMYAYGFKTKEEMLQYVKENDYLKPAVYTEKLYEKVELVKRSNLTALHDARKIWEQEREKIKNER